MWYELEPWLSLAFLAGSVFHGGGGCVRSPKAFCGVGRVDLIGALACEEQARFVIAALREMISTGRGGRVHFWNEG